MWTSRSLGMHDKPVAVLDPDGLFDAALGVPGVAARPWLRPAAALDTLIRVRSVDEAFAALNL